MPRYAYTATGPDGRPARGRIEAASAGAAGVVLAGRDLRDVRLVARPGLRFGLTSDELPRKDLMHLSRQLGTFLQAGIPVLRALGLLIDQDLGGKLLRRALEDMAASIRAGDTIAAAAAAHPEVFPEYYVGILAAAERTGTVDTVLLRLAEYIERDLEERRKLVSALVYPAVVIALAAVTVLILTIWVLPRFEALFEEFDADLPFPTRVLLGIGRVGSIWWLLLAVPAAIGLALWLLATRTERGRRAKDRLVLRLPAVGTAVRFALTERLARMLGPMVAAGIPMPEALRITAEGFENRVFRDGLLGARTAVLAGEGVAEPLAATRLFPAAVGDMIRVGEETGTIDEQFEHAADYSATELEYRLKHITSLFEPILIVGIGLVVGFVALGVVSAMYGIYRQVDL